MRFNSIVPGQRLAAGDLYMNDASVPDSYIILDDSLNGYNHVVPSNTYYNIGQLNILELDLPSNNRGKVNHKTVPIIDFLATPASSDGWDFLNVALPALDQDEYALSITFETNQWVNINRQTGSYTKRILSIDLYDGTNVVSKETIIGVTPPQGVTYNEATTFKTAIRCKLYKMLQTLSIDVHHYDQTMGGLGSIIRLKWDQAGLTTSSVVDWPADFNALPVGMGNIHNVSDLRLYQANYPDNQIALAIMQATDDVDLSGGFIKI